MLVFKVGGKAVLPENKPYTALALNPPPSTAAADVIAQGGDVYARNCAVCHGAGGTQQRTSFPNLTVTPLLYSQAGFDQVVLGGMRADKGMGSFAKDVSATDAVAVREYLISRANEIKRNPPAAPGGFGGPPPAAVPPAPARPPATTPDVHEEAARK
jgi:mono/diheme cytochrome c family protein